MLIMILFADQKYFINRWSAHSCEGNHPDESRSGCEVSAVSHHQPSCKDNSEKRSHSPHLCSTSSFPSWSCSKEASDLNPSWCRRDWEDCHRFQNYPENPRGGFAEVATWGLWVWCCSQGCWAADHDQCPPAAAQARHSQGRFECDLRRTTHLHWCEGGGCRRTPPPHWSLRHWVWPAPDWAWLAGWCWCEGRAGSGMWWRSVCVRRPLRTLPSPPTRRRQTAWSWCPPCWPSRTPGWPSCRPWRGWCCRTGRWSGGEIWPGQRRLSESRQESAGGYSDPHCQASR